MSVDLKKHGEAMKKACKDVTSDKTDINWALFGYEGQTNVLNVVSTGEDGVQELVDDFNPSKIQYAFLKVEDPKTSLPKFVLINWQGETAPGTRKGACVRHLGDIERFLAGHHITISVRNEDELDEDEILDKVSKCTVSQFNFKEKPTGMDHSPKPVGTAHKKINPMMELPTLKLREEFWEKDQTDEKRRILVDRERKVKEQQDVELVRKKREEKESKERDDKIKEREKIVAAQRQQEDLASKTGRGEDQKAWERQREEDARDAEERNRRSEVMRRERNKEAQELVRQRDSGAKQVFQRNSSQGQMNFRGPTSPGVLTTPPVFSSSSSVTTAPIVQEEASPSTPGITPTPSSSDLASDVSDISPNPSTDVTSAPPSDIAPPPPAFDTRAQSPQQEEEGEGQLHHASPATVVLETADNQEREPISPTQDVEATSPTQEGSPAHEGSPTSGGLDSYGMCAVALYDYQATDETEISFDPGQIISHIDQIDPGWWQGLGPTGNYGLFPANYVEVIDNQELQVM